MDNKSKQIFSIVLTGGPCAGKTTALDRLSAYLRERGYRVFTVPEAATMLFSNGVFFSDIAEEGKLINFQTTLMSTQLDLEDKFRELAKNTDETCVLICDRGACDGKAYLTPEGWQQVMAQKGLDNEVVIREGRYDAVLHMVTAAKGAESFYSLVSNDTRTESISQACQLDERTQQAWMGHPRHYVFDNENKTNFEQKMRRVVDTVAKVVGLPLVQRTPTKFLLNEQNPIIRSPQSVEGAAETTPSDDLVADALRRELSAVGECGEHLQVFDVEKIYVLVGGGPEDYGPQAHGEMPLEMTSTLQYSFIRRRSQKGFSVYGHTTVSTHKSGERVEVKRIMTRPEFEWMRSMYADPKRNVVIQRRYCFLWQGKTYSLYRYLEPLDSLFILHCQAAWKPKDSVDRGSEDVDSKVVFPPFLNVGESLNEDGKFSAYRISLKADARGTTAAVENKV
jgi:predicted ATPase